MNTQQSDPVPNHRGVPEDAPSPPSAEAGAELTDYNLWQLRKESREAEAQRKGRSVGSDQTTEPYSPPHFARFKPSTVEVPPIDWAALNAEVSKTHKREPPLSDKARVKFEDGWVFGLDNIRARCAAEMAAVTDQEKQTEGLNPNKKRPLDQSTEDDGSSTKRQRVKPHATFGYPGVFSSSYKGPDSNPKAPEASSPPVQNENSTFRSIFGTPAVKDSEPSSSSFPPQQQSVLGHFPPKPSAKPESSSLFDPIPPNLSAKLPVDEASLFESSNQTPQLSKRPQTTSELFGFNETTSADSLGIQASEGATKGPRPTSGLFGFIDATPPDSLAVQASDDATTKPPPSSGLFGFNHTTPADNDSLTMIQASTHTTTKPQDRAIAATMDMDAYLSTPNLFGAPSPPHDEPTTTAPAQKPMKRMEPRVYSMLHPKTHSTFSMDTMQERFFERVDANDVIHPLDEAGAPLDLESYLPPRFPRYYETRHLNETSLFLSRAKYFISLGGPPLTDMTYGIVVVPFGEERLLLCGHSITHGCDKCEPGHKTTVEEEENGDKAAEKELEESRLLREVVEDHKAKKKWWKGDPSWDRNARREYLDEGCKEGEGNTERQVKEGLGNKG